MCKNTNIKIILNWYEIEGNSLVGEETIENIQASDILKLFNAPFWNNLYHCWALEESHIESIQQKVKHRINTNLYAYFVEIYNLA